MYAPNAKAATVTPWATTLARIIIWDLFVWPVWKALIPDLIAGDRQKKHNDDENNDWQLLYIQELITLIQLPVAQLTLDIQELIKTWNYNYISLVISRADKS